MILVFGKTGQVATELQRFQGVTALERNDADLLDPTACADVIWRYAPKVVINAAAYTAVDKAEEEEALATIINGNAPTVMAQVCAKSGIPLVHISTDYVFEGTGEIPWSPNDPTAPKNAYGRSKLAGEIGISASGAVHAILRTSWVFSAHGSNFVKTMLNFSKTRDAFNVVADQIGGPTPAYDIAATCLKIAEALQNNPSKSGLYHYSGAPNVSWVEFATEIFDQVGKSVSLTPIPSMDYTTAAARPLNSRLDCSATENTFGIIRPCWRSGLAKILEDLEVK